MLVTCISSNHYAQSNFTIFQEKKDLRDCIYFKNFSLDRQLLLFPFPANPALKVYNERENSTSRYLSYTGKDCSLGSKFFPLTIDLLTKETKLFDSCFSCKGINSPKVNPYDDYTKTIIAYNNQSIIVSCLLIESSLMPC